MFGAGPSDGGVMMVGEQPGHEEDLAGLPFVGPVPKGTRRLHAKPTPPEIAACLPWLEAELAVVKPTALVCLGATAAQALLGPTFRVTRHRGQWISSRWAPHVMATVHPSAILRAPDEEPRRAEMERFVADLAMLREVLAGR